MTEWHIYDSRTGKRGGFVPREFQVQVGVGRDWSVLGPQRSGPSAEAQARAHREHQAWVRNNSALNGNGNESRATWSTDSRVSRQDVSVEDPKLVALRKLRERQAGGAMGVARRLVLSVKQQIANRGQAA